jgi:hypothetical protein
MLDMDTDTKEALSESLFDLKHDLGKYIRLPVSMLPKDASWDEVVIQAERGVLHTRKGPAGEIAAVALFENFASEWGERLAAVDEYWGVERAVSDAHALLDRIRRNEPGLSRGEVEQTLGAVSSAIQLLMEEVANG